ncbi:diguanylate cyclase [Pontixanthobacter aestiaquae]|uniref:diguanylate cyclase n=2 Tax=Pontixanthobacter aestiaquae TaxID=1509367 RepID=A0A844Z670_9SPHN|nr:diguanylate cyclase [Pontixanthobacter aestiaquae]MDN3646684.1 diguanylate cyclase [Pontixanthobacter aestiaquae]MXO82333.1 diguanylate cyclase [Pontixanthobacter aestiaquae]
MMAFCAVLTCISPAYAGERHDNTNYAPNCSAVASATADAVEVIADPQLWNCSGADYASGQQVTYLRFDASDWQGSLTPVNFFTRISRFQSITLYAYDADGWVDSIAYRPEDARPIAAGPVFTLELPEIGPETTEVIARIEGPHSVTMLSEARLSTTADGAEWTQIDVMLLVLIVGILISPLIFDLSFYIVLRERFVMIHAGMVATMIGYVMFAGGVITIFADVSVTTMAILGPFLWAVGVALGAFFMVEFLEEDAIPPSMRNLMRWCGWWVLLVPGFFSLQLKATQSFDDTAYFVAFIPVIAVYTACLLIALIRGSRSAKFLAGAWLPIIFAATDRLLRGMDIYTGPSTLDQLLYLALGAEVVIIAIGVADRFLAMRVERDRAIIQTDLLKKTAERDPLTNLFNRRMIDRRFAKLKQDGFNTIALIDLDRFKEINDQFGHATGDAALKATADALRSEPGRDMIALRMGGEEFMLIARGKDARQRLERIRQAIPARIAHDVPGLDRTVTASMGMIEIRPSGLEQATLDDLYHRADTLLYEAKQNGRNRTMHERLTMFAGKPEEEEEDEEAA